MGFCETCVFKSSILKLDILFLVFKENKLVFSVTANEQSTDNL